MNDSLLQEAIDAVQIRDVYLKNLTADTADDFDPKYWDYAGVIFQRRQAVKGYSIGEVKGFGDILRVDLAYGARWTESVESENEELNEHILATIEAEFIAEYALKKDVSKEALEAFAFRNANYHVWPYWRELLMSQVTRMHLPRMAIPAFQLGESDRD